MHSRAEGFCWKASLSDMICIFYQMLSLLLEDKHVKDSFVHKQNSKTPVYLWARVCVLNKTGIASKEGMPLLQDLDAVCVWNGEGEGAGQKLRATPS